MTKPTPPRKPKKKKSNRRQAEPDLFETAVPAEHSTARIHFAGTKNPRDLRVLNALLLNPSLTRAHIDKVAGCANGPDLISRLRKLGLGNNGLPCTMIPDRDRDGRPIKRGVYHLSEPGKRAVGTSMRQSGRKANE
jgi:hypothetical protein